MYPHKSDTLALWLITPTVPAAQMECESLWESLSTSRARLQERHFKIGISSSVTDPCLKCITYTSIYAPNLGRRTTVLPDVDKAGTELFLTGREQGATATATFTKKLFYPFRASQAYPPLYNSLCPYR